MITLTGTTVSINSQSPKECKPSKKLNQLAKEIEAMSKHPKWIEYLTKFDDNSHSQNGKNNKNNGGGGSKNGNA